jgi:hypothetical protein
MPAPYRIKLSAVAVRIETTSGTDSVPTLLANAIKTIGVATIAPDYIESGSREDVQTAGYGEVARAAPGGRFGTVQLRMEARGSGTAYAAAASRPEVDVLLRAAGFTPTNTGDTWTYDPADNPAETCTVYGWRAGMLYKLVGCVAHARLTARAGQRAFWTFDVTGAMTTDPAAASLTTVTTNNTIPPLFVGSAVAIGSFVYAGGLLVRSVDLDVPVTVATRDAAGHPDGLVGYAITDRRVRLTEEIEMPDPATFEPFALSKQAGSGGTSTIGSFQIGATQYNRVKVDHGQWSLGVPQPGDNAGIATYTLTGGIVQGSLPANSKEIRITFD